MKLANAIKKVEKAGLTLESSDGQYWVTVNGMTLGFRAQEDWRNSGSRIAINFKVTFTALLEKDTHPMNGNCYTSYYDNLTKCLNAFKRYAGLVETR